MSKALLSKVILALVSAIFLVCVAIIWLSGPSVRFNNILVRQIGGYPDLPQDARDEGWKYGSLVMQEVLRLPPPVYVRVPEESKAKTLAVILKMYSGEALPILEGFKRNSSLDVRAALACERFWRAVQYCYEFSDSKSVDRDSEILLRWHKPLSTKDAVAMIAQAYLDYLEIIDKNRFPEAYKLVKPYLPPED